MTKPKPFLRRQGVIDWLEPLGFSASQVDRMIEAGTIVGHVFIGGQLVERAAKGKAEKADGEKAGEKPKKRNYYRAAQIARALGLTES